MASITVHAGYQIDITKLDLSSLLFGDDYYYSSRLFGVYNYDEYYDPAGVVLFSGSGFKYDAYGYPKAGTVTSFVQYSYGEKVFTVSGVSVKATSLLDAALTFGTADDKKLVAKVLNGNDKLTGNSGTDRLLGYNGEDKLAGKNGSDTLEGGNGNDTVIGGNGNDKLKGGAGADRFVFDSKLDAALNVDAISDFKHNTDVIALENKVFKDIGGRLDKSEFYSAKGAIEAHDKSDRIVYDKKTGKLYYDEDGKGGDDAVHFATLTSKPTLDHGDFIIV